MKLDNKGWGLAEMVIICCGVLFCLLIIIYYVNAFQGSVDEVEKEEDNFSEKEPEVDDEESAIEPSVNKYEDYLVLLQEKAISYVLDGNVLEEETDIYVPIEDLVVNNYVDKLEDCDGHVEVTKTGETYLAKAFMSCSNYSNEDSL